MELKESEFNIALLFLSKIHQSFIFTSNARQQQDAYTWSIHLSDIFLDLINDVPNKDKEEKLNELQTLMDKSANHSQLLLKKGIPPHIPRDLFWRLYNFEIYLKNIFDKAGYQTRRKELPSEALK